MSIRIIKETIFCLEVFFHVTGWWICNGCHQFNCLTLIKEDLNRNATKKFSKLKLQVGIFLAKSSQLFHGSIVSVRKSFLKLVFEKEQKSVLIRCCKREFFTKNIFFRSFWPQKKHLKVYFWYLALRLKLYMLKRLNRCTKYGIKLRGHKLVKRALEQLSIKCESWTRRQKMWFNREMQAFDSLKETNKNCASPPNIYVLCFF